MTGCHVGLCLSSNKSREKDVGGRTGSKKDGLTSLTREQNSQISVLLSLLLSFCQFTRRYMKKKNFFPYSLIFEVTYLQRRSRQEMQRCVTDVSSEDVRWNRHSRINVLISQGEHPLVYFQYTVIFVSGRSSQPPTSSCCL